MKKIYQKTLIEKKIGKAVSISDKTDLKAKGLLTWRESLPKMLSSLGIYNNFTCICT